MVITPTITVTATAYSIGQSVGGKIKLSGVNAIPGGEAFLHHIEILDRSNTKPAGDLLFFNADPTAATLTDNASFVYSTDDKKQDARVHVYASNYQTINSKATADLPNIGVIVKSAATTDLWVAFVMDGTSNPTFTATTDLQIVFKFALKNK